MTIDVVNVENEKVGSLDLNAELFGGPENPDLLWEAVVHQSASERRGTHATKTRALVSGSGRKPWRQKGTGRARVGEIRNPLWRKGGTVFGPQPRSYAYRLPRKVARGALRSALVQQIREGGVIVVDQLMLPEQKTKHAAELLDRLGVERRRRTLVVDVQPDEQFARAVRNLPGVRVVATRNLTARDVLDTTRVIATRAAMERLQAALSPRRALRGALSPAPSARPTREHGEDKASARAKNTKKKRA